MQKQKHGFWLFIFSLIPGAGEMYMGFKKQGLSIMLLFWGVFAVGSFAGMEWLIFLIPIIWFYSFFNVHNLKSLSEEEFYSIEDSYIFHMDEMAGDINSLVSHHRKPTAILLIIFGASILWNNIVDFFYIILPGYLADVLETFAYHLPQLVIAVCIILAGVYILIRKKEELDDKESLSKNEHYQTPYHPFQQDIKNLGNTGKDTTTAEKTTNAKNTENVMGSIDTANAESSVNTADMTVNNRQPVSLKKVFSEETDDTDNSNN